MISESDWSPSDGLTLEPNALNAAKETLHNQVLTAGPGAGKTEMLAQRADFLLRTGACPYPKRILAISFKVDASTNLKARVKKRSGAFLCSRFDSYTFHAFAKKIIDQFRVVLTGVDAIDADYKIGDRRVGSEQIAFGDLIPLAIKVLQSSSIALKAVRWTYSDVFLDEFQDCTEDQYTLIKIAFQGTSTRLTAVGDLKQRIMGWAGALEGIFASYATDFNAIELVLYRNFRSKPQILRVQNSIINFMDPASVMTEDQIAGNDGLVAIEGFTTSSEEAEFIANYIGNLVNFEGVLKSEIAVLVKSQIGLYTFELRSALDQLGLAYRNEQELQDITTQPIARLVADFFLVVLGQKEPHSWERLMNTVTPYVESDQEQKIQLGWLEFFKDTRREIKLLTSITSQNFDGVWHFSESFFLRVGRSTIKALSPEYESESRVIQLLQETKNHLNALFESTQDLHAATKLFFDDDAIRLLTIHKSKGLEFDSVILLGVEKEAYWARDSAGELENLRSFFVGVSRAKRTLLLTHSTQRERPHEFSGFWKEQRIAHQQYLDFVQPFINC